MTGASFILMHKVQDKPENAKEVLKFFDWSFKNGAKMADELDYVPMPDPVVKLIALGLEGDQGPVGQGALLTDDPSPGGFEPECGKGAGRRPFLLRPRLIS